MSNITRKFSRLAFAILMATILTPRLAEAKKYAEEPAAASAQGSCAVVDLTRSFQEEVENVKGPVIVDFWASFCGPCKKFGPVFDKVSDEFAGKIKFVKVQVDGKNPQAQAAAQKYNARSIPTIVFMKDGKEIARKVGGMSRDQLVSMIKESFGL